MNFVIIDNVKTLVESLWNSRELDFDVGFVWSSTWGLICLAYKVAFPLLSIT